MDKVTDIITNGNNNNILIISILVGFVFVVALITVSILIAKGAKVKFGNIQLGKDKIQLSISKERNSNHEYLVNSIWDNLANKKSSIDYIFTPYIDNPETIRGYIDTIFEELFRTLRKNHLEEFFKDKALIKNWITTIDRNIESNIKQYNVRYKKSDTKDLMPIIRKELLYPILHDSIILIQDYYKSTLEFIESNLDNDANIIEDLQRLKNEFENKFKVVSTIKITLNSKNNEWIIE